MLIETISNTKINTKPSNISSQTNSVNSDPFLNLWKTEKAKKAEIDFFSDIFRNIIFFKDEGIFSTRWMKENSSTSLLLLSFLFRLNSVSMKCSDKAVEETNWRWRGGNEENITKISLEFWNTQVKEIG